MLNTIIIGDGPLIQYQQSMTKDYTIDVVNKAIQKLKIPNLTVRPGGELTHTLPYKLESWGIFKKRCKKPNEYYHCYGYLSYNKENNTLSITYANTLVSFNELMTILAYCILIEPLFEDLGLQFNKDINDFPPYIIRHEPTPKMYY